MEVIIFALLVAAIATRKGLADIPFMVRGQNPPSHQRRMAEMAQREIAAQRRHEQRMARTTRPRGKARAYGAALWGHAWQTAAERRRAKWEVRDPVKSEAYRSKIQAKLDGTYRGPIRRTKDKAVAVHQRAKQAARGAAFDAMDRVMDGQVDDSVLTDREKAQDARVRAADRAAFVAGSPLMATTDANIAAAAAAERSGDTDASVAAEPTPEGEAAAEVPSTPACAACGRPGTDDDPLAPFDDAPPIHRSHTTDERSGFYGARERLTDGSEQMPWLCRKDGCGRVHAYGTFARDDGLVDVKGTCQECGDESQVIDEHGGTGRDDSQPEHDHATSTTDPKENTMPTAPSEAVGVDEFAAALEEHRHAAEGGTPALEGLIASAQQQHVGPSVTDPLAQAQEAYAQFVALIDQAQEGLQQSVNVGESYGANPDAGDAAFVTNGARS